MAMGYRVEETIEADSKSSAADLLATRVSGESIEVLSNSAVPIGEWAAFELRLNTGDVFLEGMGRCEACASSGAGHRVRLGTLQFDVMNEVMFERVHLAAESFMTGERTGEVDIAALEALRKSQQAAPPAPKAAPARVPSPSPSMAPSGTPPKISAAQSTPSWRPPPPMRSRAAPSAPPRPKTPTLRAPSVPAATRPQISIPAKFEVPSDAPLPVEATKADMLRPRPEFSPSGFPPPLAPPPIAPPPEAEPEESVFESVAPPEPKSAPAKPRTVSGFPAPPPEPVVEAPRSAPSYRAAAPSSAAPKGDGGARARLEPLLLAMRRGGAARHIEDAEELAMELGLQALERIFGD